MRLRHLASGLLMALPLTIQAQSQEALAITNCLSLVRSCCMQGGEISMTPDPSHRWVVPYFSNQAALALLADGELADLSKVSAWIRWYAAHQLLDGSIDDWNTISVDGKPAMFQDTGSADSEDSYAAGFLQVCEGYFARTGGLPSGSLGAAQKAFALLLSLQQPDGLTWAKRNYLIKYLEDNAEVYGGAVSARKLFTAYRDSARAAQATALRDGVGGALPKFWNPGLQLWASDKNSLGVYEVPLGANTRATTGLANLCGFAWISATNRVPWNYVVAHYTPDSGPAPQAPVEWFYAASLRLPSGAPQTGTFRSEAIAAGQGFGGLNWYVQRPAVTALTLLKGPDWMPNLEHGDL